MINDVVRDVYARYDARCFVIYAYMRLYAVIFFFARLRALLPPLRGCFERALLAASARLFFRDTFTVQRAPLSHDAAPATAAKSVVRHYRATPVQRAPTTIRR